MENKINLFLLPFLLLSNNLHAELLFLRKIPGGLEPIKRDDEVCKKYLKLSLNTNGLNACLRTSPKVKLLNFLCLDIAAKRYLYKQKLNEMDPSLQVCLIPNLLYEDIFWSFGDEKIPNPYIRQGPVFFMSYLTVTRT